MNSIAIGKQVRLPLHHRIILALMTLGYVLLPFSTEPSSDTIVISYGIPPLGLAAAIVILSLLTNYLKVDPILHLPIALALFHIAAIWFSIPFSQDLYASVYRASSQLIGFALFLYILALKKIDEKFRREIFQRLIFLIVVSGTILSLYFLFNFVVSARDHGISAVLLSRTVGGLLALPWGASNLIASVLIIPLFLAINRMQEKSKTRWRFAIAIPIIFSAIFITQSRTSVICIVVGLLALALLNVSWKMFFSFVIIIIGGFILVQRYMPEMIDIIMSRAIDSTEFYNFNGRQNMWQLMIADFWRYPFTLHGYYGNLSWYGFSAHNLILNTLLEQTVVGLFAILALYFSAITWSFKTSRNREDIYKRYGYTCLVTITVLFLNSQFEDANFSQPYAIYFWTFLGLLFLARYMPSTQLWHATKPLKYQNSYRYVVIK